MKKVVFVLLCALLCAAFSFALAEKDGNFEYDVQRDGTAMITKYTGTETVMTVPDTIKGKTVTALDSLLSGYDDQKTVTTVVLPDTVTSVNPEAFKYFRALTEFRVGRANPALAAVDGVLFGKQDRSLLCYPQGLTATSYEIRDGIRVIGDYAFYSARLTSVTIPDSVTRIGNYSFYYSSLKTATVPSGVTAIGEGAFERSSLKKVMVQAGVQNIGKWAFTWCESLANITLGEGLTEIGDWAFQGTAITAIVLPDSVSTIGSNPFSACKYLTEIQVSGMHPKLTVVDHALISKEDGRLICYPIGLKPAAYTVPEGVISIGDWSFRGCANLTTVTLPDHLTSVGKYAFYECSSLKSVTIPDSVTSIGGSAFEKCSSLTSMTIPDKVTSIGLGAFYNCKALKSVTIRGNDTELGSNVFKNCSKDLVVSVIQGSKAEKYCRDNAIQYVYLEDEDYDPWEWLKP